MPTLPTLCIYRKYSHLDDNVHERMLDIFLTNIHLFFICRQSRSNPITNEINFLNVEQMGKCLKRQKDRSLWKGIIGSSEYEDCTYDVPDVPVATETDLSKYL